MMWRWAIVPAVVGLAAMLVGSGAAAAKAARHDKPFTASGVVRSGRDKDGTIWFELVQDGERFELARNKAAGADAIFAALKSSYQKQQRVEVLFDGNSGHFEGDLIEPVYVATALVYQGKTLAAEDSHAAQPPAGDAKAALARSIALLQQGDFDGALRSVDDALSQQLPLPFEVLALKTRGNARYTEAVTMYPIGPQRDALLASALKDFRQSETFAPDDPDAIANVAFTLQGLGGYQDAIDHLMVALAKRPKEAFWTYVDIGISYRAMGEPDFALEELNDLEAAQGPQTGMAFHYHRGWDLSEMGRMGEAADEYTKGLASQPGYSWAYSRRACALAALGKLRSALADQRRAVAMWHDAMDVLPASAMNEHDGKRFDEVAAILETAVAKDEHAKLDGLCTGYWDAGFMARDRSPLLPPYPHG